MVHPCRGLTVASVFLLGGSVGLGLWCAWSRLQDFRLTAEITRTSDEIRRDDLRAEAKAHGKLSWLLLKGQLWLFGLGALFVGARVVF